MPSWFITGASRGIGFEFTRQLSEDPDNIVIATCRNLDGASDLKAVSAIAKGQVHIVKLDVEDQSSIESAAAEATKILGDKGLDYLMNNAGVNPGFDLILSTTSAQTLEYCFRNNVVGPTLVAQAFLHLLERGNRKVIMNMSSGLGSMGRGMGAICAAYAISKAAVNMLTYKMSAERPDLIVVCVDPGWVKTTLGGEAAELEPHESVTPFIAFLKTLTKEHSGKFFDYKGDSSPW